MYLSMYLCICLSIYIYLSIYLHLFSIIIYVYIYIYIYMCIKRERDFIYWWGTAGLNKEATPQHIPKQKNMDRLGNPRHLPARLIRRFRFRALHISQPWIEVNLQQKSTSSKSQPWGRGRGWRCSRSPTFWSRPPPAAPTYKVTRECERQCVRERECVWE